ncbi:CvpA family protein [Hydrogenophaga pseudoflava]|uniref:CvpA family protein n=1 Tax=Hydrogenophaga pseudoflava TaxID=47421 RepID=UPI0027E4D0E2|nr:CvpA family protein [Hydrogenophaga pseudoflava]MDQ7745394.1 CvpA family protein [Hydrogenophaga pseudoflava]
MNAVDGVLLFVLLLSAVVGMWRGLVYEVLSLMAWVAAFVLAQAYAGEVARLLPLDGLSAALRTAVAFALVFVASAFAGGFVAWLVKKLVAAVGLRPIDRVLGGVFGLLRGVVVLLAVAVVVGMTPFQSQDAWQASAVARMLGDSLHTLRPLLPEPVARYLT